MSNSKHEADSKFDKMIRDLYSRPIPAWRSYEGGDLPVGTVLQSIYSTMKVRVKKRHDGKAAGFDVVRLDVHEEFFLSEKELLRWRIK